jgi:hypothetical protein
MFTRCREIRVASHMSQELWPWNCESPEREYPLPKAPLKSCSVAMDPQSIVTGPSTKCYFNEFLFKWVLTHDKLWWINGCEFYECHGLLILCWVYLWEVVFENNPSDHERWSIWCHVENHVDFTRCECKMDVKSTWFIIWHQMDHVSWSLGLF